MDRSGGLMLSFLPRPATCRSLWLFFFVVVLVIVFGGFFPADAQVTNQRLYAAAIYVRAEINAGRPKSCFAAFIRQYVSRIHLA